MIKCKNLFCIRFNESRNNNCELYPYNVSIENYCKKYQMFQDYLDELNDQELLNNIIGG